MRAELVASNFNDRAKIDPTIEGDRKEIIRIKRAYNIRASTVKAKKTNQVLELASKHLSPGVISKATGIPETTVKNIIKKYSSIFKELKNVSDFRNLKTEILDAAQLDVLKNGLTDEKMHKASLMQSMQAFEILNKANRLEKGQSTENVEKHIFSSLTKDIA